MATATVVLPTGAAIMPDGTTNNAAPALFRQKSSAAAPSPFGLAMAFDAATREMAMWEFRLPADYASGPVLKVQYKMASATTGAVVVEGRLAAITPGEDALAKAYAAANSLTDSVPGTAGLIKEASITLTNADSLAAGDLVNVYLARDAASGSDTATGDMEVRTVSLEYTTL